LIAARSRLQKDCARSHGAAAEPERRKRWHGAPRAGIASDETNQNIDEPSR
jgi:hypothetical protein